MANNNPDKPEDRGDKVVYGPYKRKDGRKVKTIVDKKTGKHSSTTHARDEVEKKRGKPLPKGQEVDHKDNNRRNDSPGNHRVVSKSANVAKENKHRAGKKKG